MSAYLFVHFREKTTPDGEQVHFGLSKDGFHWETVNDGAPVLWAYHGDKGVRDFTVVRSKTTSKFYIIATDLSLAYGLRNQYHNSWAEISRNGSKHFSVWESEDLVHWTEQKLVKITNEEFGCAWAPDIIYDKEQDDYVLHWSSPHVCDGYQDKAIYYSRTRDFERYSEPKLLYRMEGGAVIDSAMYEEDGTYYLFVKRETAPVTIMLLKSACVTGPWEKIDAFDDSMSAVEGGHYEAPTAVKTEDGTWCLFLDYYGVPGAGQGYVPFVSECMESGKFVHSDKEFSFPYGFKHGTVLKITDEEYERIKAHDWSDKGWV